MSRRRKRVALPAILVVALAALTSAMPWSASACACGEFNGPVVAHGRSLYRVPWWVKVIGPAAARREHTALFWFHIGAEEDQGEGYFSQLPLPIPPAFVFTALAGSAVDEFPESDVSGVTGRGVAQVVIELSNGERLITSPQLAPRRLRDRFPWLKRLRFYDQFFAAAAEPTRAVAFDARGDVLARQPL